MCGSRAALSLCGSERKIQGLQDRQRKIKGGKHHRLIFPGHFGTQAP